MSHLGFTDSYGSSSKAVDTLFIRNKNGTYVREVGNNFVVVRVDSEASGYFEGAVDVISRGECGTTETAPDPLLDWAYCGRTENICEPLPEAPSNHRNKWFRWLSHYLCLFGINRKSLYALVDKDSSKVVAATVVGPPRTIPFDRSADEMGRNLRKPPGGMDFAIDVLANNLRMKSLGTWQHKHLPGDGFGDFLYVSIFATSPEYQGQGCGTALIEFLGDLADVDHVESYLETAGVRNTNFYAKKGGFKVHAQSNIAGFNHNGGAVSMKRAPNSTTSRNTSIPARDLTAVPKLCNQFYPKNRSGPLASCCRNCNKHKSTCSGK